MLLDIESFKHLNKEEQISYLQKRIGKDDGDRAYCKSSPKYPLHIAIKQGKEELAICFIEAIKSHGLDLNEPFSPKGDNPLTAAAYYTRVKVAESLLKAGACANFVTYKGTPLYRLTSVPLFNLAEETVKNKITLLNYLTEKGANINYIFNPCLPEEELALGEEGGTALHNLVRQACNNAEQLLYAFLEKNADVHLKSRLGHNVFQEALHFIEGNISDTDDCHEEYWKLIPELLKVTTLPYQDWEEIRIRLKAVANKLPEAKKSIQQAIKERKLLSTEEDYLPEEYRDQVRSTGKRKESPNSSNIFASPNKRLPSFNDDSEQKGESDDHGPSISSP